MGSLSMSAEGPLKVPQQPKAVFLPTNVGAECVGIPEVLTIDQPTWSSTSRGSLRSPKCDCEGGKLPFARRRFEAEKQGPLVLMNVGNSM